MKIFSLPWINFLGILWMIVKDKGRINSLLKMVPWEVTTRTMSITFCNINSDFMFIPNKKILTVLSVEIDSYTKKDIVRNMDRYMSTEDIVQKQQFRCHYCSNEWWSQDRRSATWKCALRMMTAGKRKTSSALNVVRNWLAITT